MRIIDKIFLLNASHLLLPSNLGLYSLISIIKYIGDYNMDNYENYTDIRIRELQVRMQKLGNRKNLTNRG
jgi:hypothetical protein